MKVFRIVFPAVATLSLLACSPPPTPAPAQPPAPTPCVGPTITLGEIAENPYRVISDEQPFSNYLASRLGDEGIACGRVMVVETTDAMISKLRSNEIDVYLDSVFPALMVADATGAEPILRRWRNCDPTYYSVVFSLKEGGIASIDDLRGKVIAMDQPASTSGFAMPATYLMDRGLRLRIVATAEEPLATDEVGVLFTWDDQNTRAAVLNGSVAAGATDDFHLIELWEKDDPGKFTVLARTMEEPRQVVLVRANLESSLKTAIKQELLLAADDPEGRKAMENAVGTCKFDDTPEGIAASLDRMRAMAQKLRQIPGWEDALREGN